MTMPGKRLRRKRFILFLLLGSLLASSAVAPAQAAKIRYIFDGWAGPPLRVHATRPPGLAADRPVVIVMHGVQRNARDYRDQWHELATRHRFLLLAPEFNARDFPGAEGYNLGDRRTADGRLRPRDRWAYAALEPVFDDARRRFGATTDRYALYGHSAGAQFVQRLVFCALSLPLTVLLGEADNDPQHPSLRRTPEALAQGATRLERGQRFFATARDYAERQDVPFNWRQVLVPDVGHDNRLMAPAAIPWLLGEDGVTE
jgi:hypothetical protein